MIDWKERARQFADRVVLPSLASSDNIQHLPVSIFREAGVQGLLGIEIPKINGGQEQPFSTKAKICEILAGADFGAAMALVNSHNVAKRLADAENPIFSQTIHDLILGKKIGCTALTEQDAGSDLSKMTMRASPTDKGWVLSGEKVWITNAAIADTIIVYAQTRDIGDIHGIAAFLVDAKEPGFKRGPSANLGSQFWGGSGRFILNNHFVSSACVIAAPGQAFKSIMSEINGARIYVAAMCCGMMQASLKLVSEFGHQRSSFGTSLHRHQGWRWILAEAASELAAIQSLVQQASQELNERKDVQLIAAQTKIAATRCIERHLPALSHAMGAEGLDDRHCLNRHITAMRMVSLVDGSTEMLLERVAKLST